MLFEALLPMGGIIFACEVRWGGGCFAPINALKKGGPSINYPIKVHETLSSKHMRRKKLKGFLFFLFLCVTVPKMLKNMTDRFSLGVTGSAGKSLSKK